VKTFRHIGRDAVARALRGYAFAARLRRIAPRLVGAFVLVSAMLLAALGGAQAQTATVLTISHSPSSSVFGQPVTFGIVVSSTTGTGTPTGTVTLSDGTNTFGPVTVTSGPGTGQTQATLTTSGLAVGNLTITATYSSDTANFSGTSGSTPFTVQKDGAGTGIGSSVASQSTFGQSVTFTANVTAAMPGSGIPGGTVTFTVNGQTPGTTATLSGGQATFTTSTLPLGTDSITATYNGDNNFFGGTSGTVTVVVSTSSTTTTLQSSLNPSKLGQSVSFTATVSGNGTTSITGNVTFTDQTAGQTLGSVTLVPATSPSAIFTTSTLTIGTHHIVASYSGDSNFNGSSGSLDQSVGKADTNISITLPGTVMFGQTASFTATVNPDSGSAAPTGTATFSVNGGAGTSVPLNGGKAIFTTSTLPAGPDTITVTYGGDSNFNGSSNFAVQKVDKANSSTTLISSQNPSGLGQSVTFTATVSSPGGTPTGMVNFSVDSGTAVSEPLSGGVATFSTATLGTGNHTITATYLGDTNFNGSGPVSLTQNVKQGSTGTTLAASPNPSTPGQAVTFTATVTVVSGTGTPPGVVTFKDGGTTLGTGTLTPGGIATFTTSTLSPGSHNITAVYGGDTNFAGSTSAVLVQNVNATSDSTKLRELQISATPIIANAWGQAVTGAMDDAVSAGFGGNPQSLSPAGTGFTYYFNDDPPTRPQTDSDQDSLHRYLASPNGSLASPNRSANSAAANTAATDSVKRVDDDFRALGYAGGMPTKAPPPPPLSAPRDWLAWINVRGTDYFRGTFGNDLKGDQVDAFAGLTRRISPNFIVGVLGGYEHFDYSSQAFNGVLKGDGWTAGAYLGWRLAPNLRFDAGGAWSDLLANGVSGTASGHFLGTRWLINGGLTGTYSWQQFVLEPSARVFALWEHENAYTDSLGTFQPARSFETGRASAGVKAIYPFAWTSSTVALSPYAGLYADYYFSKDDAQTAGLTTVPLLQGFSARATGGVAASFAGGATLGAGGEFGGIGSANHIWTWTARGRIPF
jgi:hypothetical protein